MVLNSGPKPGIAPALRVSDTGTGLRDTNTMGGRDWEGLGVSAFFADAVVHCEEMMTDEITMQRPLIERSLTSVVRREIL